MRQPLYSESMSRRAWTAFVVVQLVGAVCVWSGPRILSAPGPVLFVTGLVLLAPGGLLSLVSRGWYRVRAPCTPLLAYRFSTWRLEAVVGLSAR